MMKPSQNRFGEHAHTRRQLMSNYYADMGPPSSIARELVPRVTRLLQAVEKNRAEEVPREYLVLFRVIDRDDRREPVSITPSPITNNHAACALTR
jgi:hypothetical protein